MQHNDIYKELNIPILRCVDCAQYYKIDGCGWCGNKRISFENARKEVPCTNKKAKKQNQIDKCI